MLNLRIRKKGLAKLMRDTLVDLPTPINITIWWNFGRILGLLLLIQIVSGLFLAIHYTCDVHLAFRSVSHIVRDVNGGWLLRTLHANGASLFFLCIFMHIGRGLYYGSFLYKGTWLRGVLLLLLLMASAFLGYVLPWGQIRFWGATVITNLFSAFPYIGDNLVSWLWGGFSVDNATLTRFFAFHFLVPMGMGAVVVVHITLLHNTGRNNPLGINSGTDKIPFHWYYTINDVVGFITMLGFILFLVFFFPYHLGEPDNFIMANPISTPAHIVPEWYFLFAYAILRSIPNKLGGVVGLFGSILILILIPFMQQYTIKGNTFYPLRKILHWLFIISFLILTIGGAWPVSEPYVSTTRVFSFLYYSYFVLFIPVRLLNDKII